ncbi:MAG: RIP metalloprotease RseP [Crocinitomicaceae bacterium]
MDFLIKAAQLILSLAILVVLHEFGHYLAARFFKIRVEKFYLFFNPWFSLVKKKIGDTEWGIGWLPLGGYVKIAGMVDESMDKEQMAQPVQPWEFRAKPAWQRLIVMIGGVVVNLIVGVVVYMFVVFTWGEEQIHTKDLSSGLSIHPYMEKYDLYSGDNILAINGKEIKHINDINNGIFLRDEYKLKVQRPDGKIENITLPEGAEYDMFENGAFPAISLRATAAIDSVNTGGSGDKAGFKKGDVFVSIAGKKVLYDEVLSIMKPLANKTIDIVVRRDGKNITLSPELSSKGTIGIVFNQYKLIDNSKIRQIDYTFGQSFRRGVARGYTTLSDYVGQMKFLFTKKGATSIGGFGAIGNMFPASWDWEKFWLNTALISIILAFMNILPIPALDGGHVVFLIYEMVRGKEAPQKVLETAQYIGFFILMGLLLYANGNDIYRLIAGG